MLKVALTFSFAALGLTLLAAAAQAQSAPAGSWTTKKPLAAGPRNEVALAAIGDKVLWSAAASPATRCRWSTATIRRPTPGNR